MLFSPKQIAALAVIVIGAWSWGLLAAAASADAPPAASGGPVYKPPSRGAPTGRVGLGTRAVTAPRQVWVLAPDHAGLTLRESPSLYWYLSRPAATRVELAVMSEQGAKTLLAETVASPASAGVQKIDLARFGVRLQPGADYRWSVSFEGDPKQRSNAAAIQRVTAGPDVARRLEGAPRAALASLYAEEGIWYDAIAAISELIEQSPKDAGLRRQRAALLEQVGLKEAAAGDASR